MNPATALKASTDIQTDFIKGLSSRSHPSLGAVLETLVHTTSGLLGASACAIFTIDGGRTRATQVAGSGYQKQFDGMNDVRVVPSHDVADSPTPGEQLGLTGWILSTGMPFLASSPDAVQRHPHHSGRPQGQDGEIVLQSFLGVPIRGLYGEVIGLIKAERRLHDPNPESDRTAMPFSSDDELTLETMARVAARCIIYLQMLAANNQHADVVTAWSRDVITEAAETEGELDSFLHTSAKVAAAALGADSCGIFLQDEAGQTLTQRAGIGSQALRKVIRSYPWPDPVMIHGCIGTPSCSPPNCRNIEARPKEQRVGLTAWIAATGKEFHARNYQELTAHCHHKGDFDPVNFGEDEICGAFLGTPLRVGGATIGVIKVENRAKRGERDERDFGEEAQRRFRTIADDIALAIKRLQSQIPHRYEIIEKAKNTLFTILRGGLGIEDLATTVVEETRALFNAGACALFLKEGDELVQRAWAASGWAAGGLDIRRYKLAQPGTIKEKPSNDDEKVGLTVWIAATQTKFLARSNQELRMHPHHKGTFDKYNFQPGEQCESFMGFPLLIKQGNETELVGVLKVETKTRGEGDDKTFTYFSELDEIVFDLIANSAAVAIQNASLRRSEARARDDAWKEFTAMAAHRVGSEAADIGGAVQGLRRQLAKSSEAPGTAHFWTRVAESLRRIDMLVAEFTEFTRPRLPNRGAIDLNELCRRAAAGRDDIRIRLELAPELPLMWGDEEQLLYCLKEMVQNSFKAVPEGGELTIRTKVTRHGNGLGLDLIDNGPGVKWEFKDKIFEPAFRDRTGGTGLGLAIVRRVINEHRGTVLERGTPGKGAHFVIEMPILAPEKTPPKRILIVDDNVNARADLEDHLRSADREICLACNEIEAAELLGNRFDLVITDIDLEAAGGARTGGLTVMEAVRKDGAVTPIIVVTAYGKSVVPASSSRGDSYPVLVEDRARELECILIPRTSDYLMKVQTIVARILDMREKPRHDAERGIRSWTEAGHLSFDRADT